MSKTLSNFRLTTDISDDRKFFLNVSYQLEMSNEQLHLPLPGLSHIGVRRRIPEPTPTPKDLVTMEWMPFYPPNDTDLWPKTVGEIGSEYMEAILRMDPEQQAIGSKLL